MPNPFNVKRKQGGPRPAPQPVQQGQPQPQGARLASVLSAEELDALHKLQAEIKKLEIGLTRKKLDLQELIVGYQEKYEVYD